jgi:hypothetical protein
MRKLMTPSEMKLFKQRVIREYREKHRNQGNKSALDIAAERLKTITPFNLVIGSVSLLIVGIFLGWDKAVYMLLSGIIYVTIVSTVLAALFKSK